MIKQITKKILEKVIKAPEVYGKCTALCTVLAIAWDAAGGL